MSKFGGGVAVLLVVGCWLVALCSGFPHPDHVSSVPHGRPEVSRRTFISKGVESEIDGIAARMTNPDLAQLFRNAHPNTLDTTVLEHTPQDQTTNQPDSFIITGDIHAMWLRDSTNQVDSYVHVAREDEPLRVMLEGLIRRQIHSVLLDPYANAFNYDCQGHRGHQDDITTKPSFLGTTTNAMTSCIWERKFEIDSLASVLQLCGRYYEETRDLRPFDSSFVAGMHAVYDVLIEQQKGSDEEDGTPVYTFQRETTQPTDSLSHGIGWPCRRTGMVKSHFRPSDDAAHLPYPVAANAMLAVNLRRAATVLAAVAEADSELRISALALENKFNELAEVITAGIYEFGVFNHPTAGEIFAYEVDGFGNAYFMDDGNIPSLLSLPYLGFVSADDLLYLNTRRAILSFANPYYNVGDAGIDGVSGPHVGWGQIWPMSIIMRARTSLDDEEILRCLDDILVSTAGTGFIHETFNQDDVSDFSRPWFAWANSIFGDLIIHLSRERPHLIF